ncbi:mitochondrial ATP synthase g subunit-domain-containing protein [Thamnocephalis sphaerospora]|uniref:Mitochondrial ATP synthase g subunit-domain-containing protein n=1 Tax=Thamnocephalis sphaerospora TaxID=78915 RepID=A0A4P9XRJ6_9FUNG|nr:mitochondrial ATP synthase g subunit-domain-containing protein [Thamnocephalis sphaerospora]|eukprot:RKP08713.1 mitochondrial ATP synthase g subunit-domain-containing protein [Thamnocephalis sphaerospora]
MASQNASAKIAQLANTARTRLSSSLNAESARKALDAASSSARNAAEAVSQRAQNAPGRFGAISQRIVYQSRVAFEIAKEVARREKLGFPSSAEWDVAKKEALEYARNWQRIRNLRNITKEDAGRAAVIGAEIFGFFLVGEIIGRRSLVGYKLD